MSRLKKEKKLNRMKIGKTIIKILREPFILLHRLF